MRRLLPLLSIFFCAPSAWATGNALVTQCTAAAATSCTLQATPAFGNFMIGMGYNGTSATVVSTPAGWTSAKSVTGNTNAIKIAFKYSVGNETTCGTWTNATATFCQVYSGAWITGGTLGGSLGNTASGITETTASTIISYPTFTLTNPLSTSWVVCGGGASGATAGADVAPSGMTLRSGTAVTTIAFSDTNGNVSSWPTTNVTYTTASHSASACVELVGTPAVSDLSSYLVHAVHFSEAGEGTTTPFTLKLPVPSSLSNNFLHLNLTWGYASTAPTVSNIYCNTDTGHATWTWTLAQSTLDTADTTDIFEYYIQGATAGCTSVSIVASVAWNNAEADYQEFRQIATSGGTDSKVAAAGATLIGPYLSAGALSPTATGDLILQHCVPAGMLQSSTNIFSSDGVIAYGPDNTYSITSEGFIETGSEALTVTDFDNGFGAEFGECTAIAVKTSAGAGTAPTSPYILTLFGSNQGLATTANFQHHNLATGDALVFVANAAESANAVQFTGVSDTTTGDSWTMKRPQDANGGYPDWAFDCNITAGNNYITVTGTSGSITTQYWLVEMVGLANTSHTACYDATAGTATGYGTGSPFSPAPTITPSTAGGIVLESSQIGTGPSTGITSPSGAIFPLGSYSGQTDTSAMGYGNNFGYLLNAAASAETWTFTTAGSSNWEASAIAFKKAAAGGVVRHRAQVIQ